MSQDTMAKVTEIMADTKAHGFRFSREIVKHEGRSYPAEIVVVEDLTAFEATFPGVAKGHLNGSSTRVGSQSISRNARGKKTPAQLFEANVKWLLGIEEESTSTVYKVLIDGVWMEFDSQEEAELAMQELAPAQA